MSKNFPRLYYYVGSEDIKRRVANYPIGTKIKSNRDIKDWIINNGQKTYNSRFIVCTFVIDSEGYLRIADRHSEHIACSGGNPVLSAGEIFFVSINNQYEIEEISNQSTGFCPESTSWFWVHQALDRISITHPGEFTTNFIFRRCPQCNLLNIIKESLFICVGCNSKLPQAWNCNSLKK